MSVCIVGVRCAGPCRLGLKLNRVDSSESVVQETVILRHHISVKDTPGLKRAGSILSSLRFGYVADAGQRRLHKTADPGGPGRAVSRALAGKRKELPAAAG